MAYLRAFLCPVGTILAWLRREPLTQELQTYLWPSFYAPLQGRIQTSQLSLPSRWKEAKNTYTIAGYQLVKLGDKEYA